MSTPAIQLDLEKHVYTVNGLITPGFSEIVRGVGLVDTTWFTAESRWRGTVVHSLCELEDQEDLDESWIDEQSNAEELRGYLAAYRKFKVETGFVPTNIEESVFNSTLNYCGTFDRRGPLNGKPALIDLKSGAVHWVTRYQTVAYVGCLADSFQYTRGAVGLKPNGNYSCVWYSPKDYRKDWAMWSSIVDVHSLMKERGLIYEHNNGNTNGGDAATNGDDGNADGL